MFSNMLSMNANRCISSKRNERSASHLEIRNQLFQEFIGTIDILVLFGCNHNVCELNRFEFLL